MPRGSLLSTTLTLRDPHNSRGRCDYYFSFGLSESTDSPGTVSMMIQAAADAFAEDKALLEAQYRRRCQRPDGNKVDIKADTGPNRMLFLLDRMLREEREAAETRRSSAG